MHVRFVIFLVIAAALVFFLRALISGSNVDRRYDELFPICRCTRDRVPSDKALEGSRVNRSAHRISEVRRPSAAQGHAMLHTVRPGTLIVASAYPDPPFDVVQDGVRGGFDVELMLALCSLLGLSLATVRYSGADFDGIFDGLSAREYDAVISGTTITPQRSARVLFSQPYLEFNQGVAVNHQLKPDISSAAELRGLTAGIQIGNTSELVAKRYLAEGKIASISYYSYDAIEAALQDLEAGRIGLVIKLYPVISWLVRDRPALRVAFAVPTHEQLGIAFAKDDEDLRTAIDAALGTLGQSGRLVELQAKWFSHSAAA